MTDGERESNLESLPSLGRLDRGRNEVATPCHQGDQVARAQGHCRSEEAKAAQHRKSHLLQDLQGPQVCARDSQGGDGPDGRHAGVWIMEDGKLQWVPMRGWLPMECHLLTGVAAHRAVQLQGLGRAPGRWSSSPPQQDATRVPVSRIAEELYLRELACTGILTRLSRQTNFLRDWLHGNAHQPVHRVWLLGMYRSTQPSLPALSKSREDKEC
jgi:hypothetical protein